MNLPAPPPPTLAELGPLPAAYQDLLDQLAQVSWICQGSVVSRPLIRLVDGHKVKKGPYYLWTCKAKGKTRCIALSQAQYLLLDRAIENNREIQKTLSRMQALTLKTILKKVPGVRKRK
jgi:hypothetical protein